MTEDWRNSIDNKEVVAAVAVDLSQRHPTSIFGKSLF